jgi:hypothetical protein
VDFHTQIVDGDPIADVAMEAVGLLDQGVRRDGVGRQKTGRQIGVFE